MSRLLFDCNASYQIKYLLCILFLGSLFIIIPLSVPGLQINDEWITANQLHQLVQGHQVLTSEGKYGTYFGEMSSYFKSRSNILGYSLALPLLASLPLFFLLSMGDFFRFGIIFFWALIPLFILFLINASKSYSNRLIEGSVLLGIMALSFFLLMSNLYLYFPFPSSIIDHPIEVAALVLTANLLFSLLCVILFLIGFEIFQDWRRSIFVAIALIACSSYMFWGTSGKDHMLSIVLFGIAFLFFCKYYSIRSNNYAFIGFFFLGMTAWVRPELGVSLFITIGALFCLQLLYQLIKNKREIKEIYKLIPVIGFIFGLIPFFINNYILTHNPLKSPFLEYMPSITSGIETGFIKEKIVYDGSAAVTKVSPEFSIENLFTLISNYYSLNSISLFNDLKGIFFFADSGSMTVAALSPLLIIGIITIPLLLIRKKQIGEFDKQIIILCIFAIFGIFLAYMRSLHGLHTSEGIAPDIRYFSPMYLPGGLLGIIGLKYWKYCPIDTKIWKLTFMGILFGSTILLVIILLTQPFGGGFFFYNYTLSLCSFGLLIIFLSQFLLMEFIGKYHPIAIKINLILLLMSPVAWQVMMVFLFSIAKFDGFTFWIPLSEIIRNSFIVPVT